MSKAITYDPNWQETYKSQILSATDAVKKIRPGQRIFIGTGVAEPLELVSALSKRAYELPDTEIVHLLTFGDAPYAHRHLVMSLLLPSLGTERSVWLGRVLQVRTSSERWSGARQRATPRVPLTAT